MRQKIQISHSGIMLVDKAWGGFYRGGTYLLIGPRKSGRTLLSLQYAMESARQKEVCLYFTSMRPKDLMIQAASIDFDLQHYMNQNLIIVVRVAPPSDLYEVGNPDEFLVEYLNDIVTVVDQYQPNKIVFDELTPFIGFSNVDLLEEVYSRTAETIEDIGITSLFTVGDPATPAASHIVDALANHSTGIIYLKKSEEDELTEMGRTQGGKMIITPNIGHTEGKFSSNYYIEPYRGITVDYGNEESNSYGESSGSVTQSRKYKSLAEIDLPNEQVSFSNIYTMNDFNLILNNQIALYKSTGQIFTIISFRLDFTAEKLGLLTISQLQNAVRLSTDKKDKICIINDKVIVLVTKDDPKGINFFIGKIKSNLPNSEPGYLSRVLQYISVYAVKVDDRVQSAEDILGQLLSEDIPEKNKLGFH